MTRVVYGYLRESNDDGMDPEGQRRDILTLADRYGYARDDIEWTSDWGQSGRKLTRKGYLRIKDDVAEGRVAAVLARSVDRLGRDAAEVIAFEALCNLHGTRVLTERDGERTGNPDEVNTFQRWVPALVAEEESRLGRLRARKARQTRTRNREEHRQACGAGDRCPDPLHWDGVQPYGTLPGEDLDAVIDAFELAKGYSGAARLLNTLGVKPRRGEAWESTSVSRVVKRSKDRLAVRLPRRRPNGSRTARAYSAHVFAQLLTCPHDGSLLTATNRSDRSGPSVGYFCRQGRQSAVRCPRHMVPVVRRLDWGWDCPEGHQLDRYAVVSDHPRPWSVSEHHILTWAMQATAFLKPERRRVVEFDGEATQDIADLQAKRLRLGQVFVDGLMTEEAYRQRLDALDGELGALQGVARATTTWHRGLDWTLPAPELNVRLHDLWVSVRLGPDMRPTGAVWRNRPVTGEVDEYGSDIPDPDAVRYDIGWYLPTLPLATNEEEAELVAAASS